MNRRAPAAVLSQVSRIGALVVGPLLVAAVLLTASSARAAACETDGLVLFPAPGGVLPTNTRFILEGIGRDQVRVSSLVGKRLVLKASDDEILVRIQRGWQSMQGRTAMRLIPARALKPGRDYTLEIDRLLPQSRLLNPKPGTELAVWRSGREPDEAPPDWRQPPSPEAGEYDARGQEVTRWITLRAALVEESPSYLVVTLRRRRSTEIQTYFVPIDGDRVRIGHDTCSGSFALENKTTYRATIEAFDCTGNSAPPVPPVELSAPAPVRP